MKPVLGGDVEQVPALLRQGGDLGALPLVPVLRLSTCVDVSSEAMLHYRYGSAASRSTSLTSARPERSASAPERLRANSASC